MDKQLWEQAKRNIEAQKSEEFDEEIQEEYENLQFEAKKVIITPEIREKITNLHKKLLKLPAIKMYDGLYLGKNASILSGYLESGKYHQEELEEIEALVKRRLKLKKKNKND